MQEGTLLEKKVCFVTGAAQGIGRAITEAFCQNGAIVYANDVRSGSVAPLAFPCSGELIPLYFDITDSAAARLAITEVKQQHGKLDVLVNNAGLEFNERIGMLSREAMQKMFQVNVFAAIELLQLAARLMVRTKTKGSIINIASMVGVHGNPGQLVYSATKGAIISLTKSAAKELAPQGIRVNAVAPGLTSTKMMDAAVAEKLQDRISRIPFGRVAEPSEIASACVFLACESLAGYVSGQILGVDGCAVL